MKNFYILLFSVFSIGLFAQNIQKLDRVYDEFEDYQKGFFSVAVQKDGKDLYFRTVGFANYEEELPANENKFRKATLFK